MAQKAYSLSHTKWMCKYHIVFTPKYRRKVIYNQIRSDVGEILRKLCEYKGIEIIEGHLMPDHVHMLVAIPPKYSVASVMGYLKGKSSLMIFDRHANLKRKFGNRKFWAEGYYVSTVGLKRPPSRNTSGSRRLPTSRRASWASRNTPTRSRNSPGLPRVMP